MDPARASAHDVCLKLIEHGVLSKDTHETVVRLAPPLVITRDEIDEALEALRAALVELEEEGTCDVGYP
jgi:ornithine--oxo-acid transaminase